MRKQELNVTVKAKELCDYIFNITERSPKKHRFTLVDRMRNNALTVVELIYFANEIFIRNDQDMKRIEERLYYQRKAITQLKMLGYLSHIAYEHQCILSKQFEKIAEYIYASANMIGAWIQSDLKKLHKG